MELLEVAMRAKAGPENFWHPFQRKCALVLSTRIKDAGIAIRHSRGGILFYTAGSRNGLKGVDIGGHQTQKAKLSSRDQVGC